MKFVLIFASLLAVAFSRRVPQPLNGVMVGIVDDVIGPNYFGGSHDMIKRNVIERGLDFGIKRVRRQEGDCPGGQVWDPTARGCRVVVICPYSTTVKCRPGRK